ncbi:MAG: hypothetical protein IJK81_05020 [Selenomonadaceae bacterium]|nr:hypothetical protein [Selenomonadaceae bacterium]
MVYKVINTLKYVATKERENFADDLKKIYTAPELPSGLAALSSMMPKSGKIANVDAVSN